MHEIEVFLGKLSATQLGLDVPPGIAGSFTLHKFGHAVKPAVRRGSPHEALSLQGEWQFAGGKAGDELPGDLSEKRSSRRSQLPEVTA